MLYFLSLQILFVFLVEQFRIIFPTVFLVTINNFNSNALGLNVCRRLMVKPLLEPQELLNKEENTLNRKQL